MGSEHESLLYRTEVKWLSRGRVIQRILQLKDELRIFLLEKKPDLADLFGDDRWMCLISYLADFFEKVNEMNFSVSSEEKY